MFIFLLLQLSLACPTKEEMSTAIYTGKCGNNRGTCCHIESRNIIRPITPDFIETEYTCCYMRTPTGINKCCDSYVKREMSNSETLGLALLMIIVFPLIGALGPRDDDW
jgi:hypothetical protein